MTIDKRKKPTRPSQETLESYHTQTKNVACITQLGE